MDSKEKIPEGTAVWAKWKNVWWAAIVASETDANDAARKATRKNHVFVFYVETAAFAWARIQSILPITAEPSPVHGGNCEAGRESVTDSSLPRIEMIHRIGKCMLDVTDGLHVKCTVNKMQTLEAWQKFASDVWESQSYVELRRHLLSLTKLILPKYFTRNWTNGYCQWKGECERADNAFALEKLIRRLGSGVNWTLVQKVWGASDSQTTEWDTWRGDKWDAWDNRGEDLKDVKKKMTGVKIRQPDKVGIVPEKEVLGDDLQSKVLEDVEDDVDTVSTCVDQISPQKTQSLHKTRRKRARVALSSSSEMDEDGSLEGETSVTSLGSSKGKPEESGSKKQKSLEHNGDREGEGEEVKSPVGIEMEVEMATLVKDSNVEEEVNCEVANVPLNDEKMEVNNEDNYLSDGLTEEVSNLSVSKTADEDNDVGMEMEVESRMKKSIDGKEVQVSNNLFSESSTTISFCLGIQDIGDECTSDLNITVNPAKAHLTIYG